MHGIARKGARYQLSLQGRITIAKTFLLPQFTYIAPDKNTYYRNFINTGTTKVSGKRNWINQVILYGPKLEGDLNFIDARSFFFSLKVSMVKRYA